VATVFTRIIDGELPGTFVWRDDRCVSFLSINPLRPGHALIVPRDEVDHWIDLEPDLARHLMTVAQTVARAQQRAFQPSRVGLIIAGMEVPHTHLHVIPIDSEADLQFANAARSVPPDELAATAAALRAALRADGAAGVSDS
jgi:histidine triad (HIT) family protein